MQFPDARLLIFAKEPIVGQVKTRLIPALGADGATRLHEALIERKLRQVSDSDLCPVELWVGSNPDHPFFLNCARRFGVPICLQHGNDLGERMAHALAATLRETCGALLIGTDCPPLDSEHLQSALAVLESGSDAVFVPAEDGGYVAVGLRQPNDAIFWGINWGTNEVMTTTRARLRAAHLSWQELDPLWDVDRPEDIQRLRRFAPDLLP